MKEDTDVDVAENDDDMTEGEHTEAREGWRGMSGRNKNRPGGSSAVCDCGNGETELSIKFGEGADVGAVVMDDRDSGLDSGVCMREGRRTGSVGVGETDRGEMEAVGDDVDETVDAGRVSDDLLHNQRTDNRVK